MSAGRYRTSSPSINAVPRRPTLQGVGAQLADAADDDTPTGRSTQAMRLYGELLRAFDALDDNARTQLVELATEWALMNADDRAALLRLVLRNRA